MRRYRHAPKQVHLATQHDIKLELDDRCQASITRLLRAGFPLAAVLGEEGVVGASDAPWRWVVDPIDGTVNFAYGIPHACVAIALQQRGPEPPQPAREKVAPVAEGCYETVLGVVYDPFVEELWTAVRGGPARLNGRVIRTSARERLCEAVVSVGFSKSRAALEAMLPVFNRLVHRVRKVRILGAAALALTYVASGRMDAYIEPAVRLWDIAAGGLILECAGGVFWHKPLPGPHAYRVLAHNGRLRRSLRALL
jgi:myo-inositol-1(or 4)-monophosphatase